ncbi:MAG: adenylate/guanylate cyclase domain-containing protein [Candidatus Binatia bacterium]
MACPSCGHDTRAQAKFCEECGAPQRPAPAATPRPYTPRHLAERILTSRAALIGERKAVTVLFADVQGSMALAEQVDAEEWHAIMNRFFAILADGVHRFEGTVNQYTGDGIMALFGAPLAHEEHAQRACHAALHLTATLRDYAQSLRRERGLQFSVRMGINTGEVVVGAIGDDLRMDYTALGHTVGLASRMEQLCEPGRVYLSGETAALVEGFFTLEDLGPFTIKGVREPVRVFALAGPGPLRTRLDASRALGLTRFVGRGAELAALETALAEADAGRGGVIALCAEAGAGKSRLCLELATRAGARGSRVAQSVALAHGAAVPYLPILGLLRALTGIGERDAAAVVRQKLAGALLLSDDAFKPHLPLLFDFLGAADLDRSAAAVADAAAFRRLLRDVLLALLRSRAGSAPALAVVEDLHWCDPASDEVVRDLAAGLAGERVLLVLDYRPQYDAQWLRAAGARIVSLAPLPAADIGALLDELLGVDPTLAPLRARLLARAGGNPFFAEELVRESVQSGVLAGVRGAHRLERPIDDGGIPTTVQAVLAARIDRLSGPDKDVLQTAAVIGKTFSAGMLARVTGLGEAALAVRLAALVGAELVAEDDADGAYVFSHPLTQEVAYAAQLHARRAAVHAAVAQALAAALEGRRPPMPRRCARTISRPPASPSRRRRGTIASPALWPARRATRRSTACVTPPACWRRRRRRRSSCRPRCAPPTTSSASVPPRACRSRRAPRRSLRRALAERSGRRDALVQLLTSFADFQMLHGQRSAADACLREASALAHGVGDPVVRLGIALDRAQTAFWAGRLGEALAQLDEAEPLLAAGAGYAGIQVGLQGTAFLHALRGMSLVMRGRVAEGFACIERAEAMADDQGSLDGRCIARVPCPRRQRHRLGAAGAGGRTGGPGPDDPQRQRDVVAHGRRHHRRRARARRPRPREHRLPGSGHDGGRGARPARMVRPAAAGRGLSSVRRSGPRRGAGGARRRAGSRRRGAHRRALRPARPGAGSGRCRRRGASA